MPRASSHRSQPRSGNAHYLQGFTTTLTEGPGVIAVEGDRVVDLVSVLARTHSGRIDCVDCPMSDCPGNGDCALFRMQ